MSKSEEQRLAKLVRKTAAKAAAAKRKSAWRYDPTLPPEPTESELHRRREESDDFDGGGEMGYRGDR